MYKNSRKTVDKLKKQTIIIDKQTEMLWKTTKKTRCQNKTNSRAVETIMAR